MKFGHIIILLALCCFGLAPFAGCGPQENKTANGHDHGEHGHDHDGHGHDHDGHDHADGELPAHGPNNGHLFKLEGSEFVGEWIHYNDNDIIRVLLLDKGLKDVIAFDGVTITPTAGSDKTPFELEHDVEKSPAGKKVIYMLDDKGLGLAMSLGVEVEFSLGDEKFKGKIAPHAPHDH